MKLYIVYAEYTYGEQTPLRAYKTKEEAQEYIDNVNNHCCTYKYRTHESFGRTEGYIWEIDLVSDTQPKCEPYMGRWDKKKGLDKPGWEEEREEYCNHDGECGKSGHAPPEDE